MPTRSTLSTALLLMALPAALSAQSCAGQWLAGEGCPGVAGAGPAAGAETVWATTTWDPDGAGPQPELLVVGGAFRVAGSAIVSNVAAWDGTTWHDMGGTDGAVNGLALYNGDLVIGGSFTTVGGVAASNIARWDGTTWHDVGGVLGGDVRALTVHGAWLVAGGTFSSAGGVTVSRIARWDGTSWQALGGGTNDAVRALTTFSGDLIAGGLFTSAGTASALRVAQWDGTSWQSLAGGIASSTSVINPRVMALTSYHGSLIAAGKFISAGFRNIARWDGNAWQPMGSGVGEVPLTIYVPTVRALAVHADTLVVGGHFLDVDGLGAPYLARWQSPPYAFVLDQPWGPGSLRLAIGCAPPGYTFLMPITTAPGAFPGGWLFGVDIDVWTLLLQIDLGPPFFGTLNANGGYGFILSSGVPPGLAFYVGCGIFDTGGVLVQSFPPTSLITL